MTLIHAYLITALTPQKFVPILGETYLKERISRLFVTFRHDILLSSLPWKPIHLATGSPPTGTTISRWRERRRTPEQTSGGSTHYWSRKTGWSAQRHWKERKGEKMIFRDTLLLSTPFFSPHLLNGEPESVNCADGKIKRQVNCQIKPY